MNRHQRRAMSSGIFDLRADRPHKFRIGVYAKGNNKPVTEREFFCKPSELAAKADEMAQERGEEIIETTAHHEPGAGYCPLLISDQGFGYAIHGIRASH